MKNTHYSVRITHTSKSVGKNDKDYHTDWTEKEEFASLKDAQEFISERYKKSQRKNKIFRDTDSEPKQVGWIYGFRDTAYNRGEPPYHYFGEDWVELRKVKTQPITNQLPNHES